ncbi:hypothetical protein C3K47_09470 [Solitalea longa]|uniref:Stationary phase survival protein SurE n=1 Tax=Solitalea longa TaxID=2079460 RepID=A0A2S5A237_9SPHI|nr:hypothetical protein [Solitalea longa]POY36594.1 hypothetical protein C3K47_09470 [Solitalea longa]
MSENIQLPSGDNPWKGLFKKDSFLFGTILGIIVPLLMFFLVEFVHLGDQMGVRDSSLYLLGLIVNLFLVRYYFKKEISNTGKGVFLISFLVVLAVFFFKS